MKSRIAYILGIITGALAVYLWLKPKLEKMDELLELEEFMEKVNEIDEKYIEQMEGQRLPANARRHRIPAGSL